MKICGLCRARSSAINYSPITGLKDLYASTKVTGAVALFVWGYVLWSFIE